MFLQGRKWQLTPVPLPRKSHGLRSLVGYSPRGRKESDTTERLHFRGTILLQNCGILWSVSLPIRMLKINKHNKLRLRERKGIVSGRRVSQRARKARGNKRRRVAARGGELRFHSLITMSGRGGQLSHDFCHSFGNGRGCLEQEQIVLIRGSGSKNSRRHEIRVLEREMATHSRIFAWEITWSEEPGRLQSRWSQRVRHDLVTEQQREESDIWSHWA